MRNKIIFGLIWQFAEKFLSQFIQFFIQILLARLLTPEDFGVVGIISVFNILAQVFIQSGFGTALIQKKEVDSEECSSVFYISLLISMIIYILLFLLAPFIASFYNTPELSKLMRVQFIGLLIMPVVNLQTVMLQKNMEFKKSFLRNTVANITSAVVGIALALLGFGVWALVISNVSNVVAGAVVLTITVRWRPKLVFSYKKVKNLFQYGSKLLISNIIDTLYNNMYSLIIGKFFNKNILGYYNKGKGFPYLVIMTLNNTIQTVIFPALSKHQDDKVKLKNLMRRSIITSTFFVFPAMFGLAAVAKPLVVILLTEKWLPAVTFLQLCCASYMFLPITTANLQAINAVGRSDIFLKLEIIKKAIGVSALIIAIPFGVHIMVLSRVIVAIISLFINAYPNKKLLDYSIFEQLYDILPSFVLSLCMGVIVWSISLLNFNYYIMIFIQVIVGVLIYVSGAKLFKFECFDYILNIVRGFFKRNDS